MCCYVPPYPHDRLPRRQVKAVVEREVEFDTRSRLEKGSITLYSYRFPGDERTARLQLDAWLCDSDDARARAANKGEWGRGHSCSWHSKMRSIMRPGQYDEEEKANTDDVTAVVLGLAAAGGSVEVLQPSSRLRVAYR